ncbi:MAG TPA: type II toxin-antitoxin system VapC family toxin [Candidatus Kapabacteria bacterium]|nr:type II toxin-antitoxin system VapC family toxin [Candidatus Kapabacteria bacterium]
MYKQILIDTDILIDFGRADLKAATYLQNMGLTHNLCISSITAMELLIGAANKQELGIIEKFIKRFSIIHIDKLVSETAYNLIKEYRLSYGLLLADALIASTSIVNNIDFISKNQKDYRFIKDLKLLSY